MTNIALTGASSTGFHLPSQLPRPFAFIDRLLAACELARVAQHRRLTTRDLERAGL